jgi:hypothetical protein
MGIAVSVTYSITGRGEYQTQREKRVGFWIRRLEITLNLIPWPPLQFMEKAKPTEQLIGEGEDY